MQIYQNSFHKYLSTKKINYVFILIEIDNFNKSQLSMCSTVVCKSCISNIEIDHKHGAIHPVHNFMRGLTGGSESCKNYKTFFI